MTIKSHDSFFKFTLLQTGDIQLNPAPTSDVCFVCKRSLNKISFCCTKCDLRSHKKCSSTVLFDSDICSDSRRWENLPFHNVSFCNVTFSTSIILLIIDNQLFLKTLKKLF